MRRSGPKVGPKGVPAGGERDNKSTQRAVLIGVVVACALVVFLAWPSAETAGSTATPSTEPKKREDTKPASPATPPSGSFAKNNHAVLSDTQLRHVSSLLDMTAEKATLLTPLLTPRVVDTPEIKRAGTFIVDTLKGLDGWTVTKDVFAQDTIIGKRTFTNIIATYGVAPRKLVLAAHYDSKMFPDLPSDQAFIGATDSAVPCALMLGVAKALTPYLAQRTKALGTTLQLIFFDGEEAFKDWTATDSIYGSRHLAKKWAKDGVLESIELFVLLDLLGAKEPTIWSAYKSTFKWHQMLASAEKRLNALGLLSEYTKAIFVPEQPAHPPQVQDDHVPFADRGVPIVHAITIPFPTTWHTPGDNESVLHYPTIDNLARILRVFVCEYLSVPVP